ncbi:PhnE/PtxC family ABC transporter permease [Paenibacillus sp. GCM10027626]|uniref:PhnE/PtxC family ABC transporter permease n=1 Tax=Paenibacillus sp. GCM10027626 TaxID=3273411 RepID=UPI0036404E6A
MSKIRIGHKSTQRQQRWFIGIMALLFIPCFFYLKFDLNQFTEGLHQIPHIADMMMQMSFTQFPELMDGLLTSLIIAFLTVVISVVISFFLAFVIATNTAPVPILAKLIRALIVIIRTIPVTIWVLLAVASIGFGSMAGVLGLIFPTVAYLTRVFSDQIDEAGKDIIEAVKAVGGGWWNLMFNGVTPQLMTAFLASVAFNFEITVAETVILGIVGAGGIGVLLQEYISFYDFKPLSLGILIVFFTLFLLEMTTNIIRLRLSGRNHK